MTTSLPPPIAAKLRDDDTFLTRREAADYLRRSVPTLERWAKLGEGPRFKKIAGKTLYSLAELRRVAGWHGA